MPKQHHATPCATTNVMHYQQDLMQFPDRLRWYEAKFAADDM